MYFFSFKPGSVYSCTLVGVCFIVLLISCPALGTQPDRNILSLSEDISLSCVLPLMEVCHRLEMQLFDVV